MFKTIIISVFLLAGVGLGFLALNQKNLAFESLSPEEMHQQIISNRGFAIQKAKDEGNYKCCIEPPCTMCYMEANIWNNHQAGTCACDDIIAQGKEPCPQCMNGLCETGQKGVCEI